jgi:hypothetical protein
MYAISGLVTVRTSVDNVFTEVLLQPGDCMRAELVFPRRLLDTLERGVFLEPIFVDREDELPHGSMPC